jgi:D-sedoheptulose 7-phosphate isomerase
MSTSDLLIRRIGGSLAAIESLRRQMTEFSVLVDLIVGRLATGGTLYTMGNGGSAAQALHLTEELIGRYRGQRRALRAICLNADPTALTCIANDFGFEQVFARQCEALLTDRDVLVALSTSGKSRNIVNALGVARSRGAATVGLLGRSGGECLALCDHAVVIGSAGAGNTVPRPEEIDSSQIQDAHQIAIHLICEAAESRFDSRDS